MRCAQCNERLSARARFCSQCGAAAPEHEIDGSVGEAKEYAKEVLAEGKVVANEAIQVTKAGMKTEIGKSVATCAAIGAVVAIPIPFVGPLFGATVGAGIGLLRKI